MLHLTPKLNKCKTSKRKEMFHTTTKTIITLFCIVPLSLKPEIIYSLFPKKIIDGNKIEEDLMRLAFPRGVEAKKRV